MRVADVSAFYTPKGGGVRTYVERKLDHAARAGIDLTMIVPGDGDRIEERTATTRLIHVDSPKLLLDRRYRYFANAAPVHQVLDGIAPDIVEASSPWRTASIVADWRGAARRSLFMHADPLAAYAYRWFDGLAARPTIDRGFDWFWAHLRRASRAYDLVVTPNPSFAQRLADGGIPRTRSIPLGVDPGIFSPVHRDPRLRAELLQSCALGPEALLLIAVGRFSAEKRWTTVIEAAALAGVDRPVALVLIGEGRGKRQLERAIAGNPHIRLHPPIRSRAAMARMMASGDALVHGCEAETFGLVAAEAVASGLPIVAPDEGGAAGQVVPGASALYPAGNPYAAAAAIGQLFADGDADRIAREAAFSARTMDAHFSELFDCYSLLMQKPAIAA